jgi:hypothetical protein
MIVTCPSCKMSLKMGPEHAGKMARCPGCSHRFVLPAEGASAAEPAAGQRSADPASQTAEPKQRSGWQEKDPANPNLGLSLLVGIGIMAAILLLGLVLRRTYVYTILFERGWVNFAETFVFGWGMSIIILKFIKLGHQRNALLLDVLPRKLGRDINPGTVGAFIDHIYKLPHRLRDSLMVNRIRKALELFEVRPSTGDVAHMLSTQSDIDSIRVAGSYSLIKVFIWAIPILGFIGTVLGLSAAIGNFSGVMGGAKDIDALMGSLGGVTSGLGTSFDTTLLGLLYSILLSFPMSALQKGEDDSLNQIDAYCNDTLLPRLNDGGGARGEGSVAGELRQIVDMIVAAQKQFVVDLRESSGFVREQVQALEARAAKQSEDLTKTVSQTLAGLERAATTGLETSTAAVTAHVAGLQRGLESLNTVLAAVGERRIRVAVRPRGFWRRLLGR